MEDHSTGLARPHSILRTIPFLITVCLVSFPAQAQYGGGTGEPNDPYLIYTVEDLVSIGSDPGSRDRHFELSQDIDLSGTTWSTALIPEFSRTFNGNGFTIRGLTIAGGDCLGLFGCLEPGSEVCDLGVLDVNVTGAGAYDVGALVGRNDRGHITRCYSTGIVSGDGYVGGLVGSNWYGTVSDCNSAGIVTGRDEVGGLIGYNDEGAVTRCHSAATVSGGESVGGLVGANCNYGNGDGMLADCYSTGPVSGDWAVGGLVGYNEGGNITRCCSGGTVSGADTIGGLVGSNYEGTLTCCYSTGTVASESFAGGLVGYNDWGSVTHCYSTGAVSGGDEVGGCVGTNDGSVTGCFWDMDASGVTISAGGFGLTTAAMVKVQTYLNAGWDLVEEAENGADDIWFMPVQDYPRLSWEFLAFDSAVGVHRFWSPVYKGHVYTIDESEKSQLLNDPEGAWQYEGVVYYAFADDVGLGLQPVHRFYCESLNGHCYTMSESEKNKLIDSYAHVWTYRGVAFHVFAEGERPNVASPVYRFWSSTLGRHFYTIDEREKGKLIDQYTHVWTFEGIAWYAYGPPQVATGAVSLTAYAPLEAGRNSILTFEWTYGRSGQFTCQIGDPITINYGDGASLTGATVTNLFGWEEGGITAFVSNDGSSVKVLGFEDPMTGEYWYASSDEYLTSHPAIMSFGSIVDGMMIDRRGSYWVTEEGWALMDIGSANLFEIQDITVPAGHYEDALVVWDLRTDASFAPLDWSGMDTALGIVSPTAADTGGFAIAGVWIFGRDQGPIASAAYELNSGRLIHLAELKFVEEVP